MYGNWTHKSVQETKPRKKPQNPSFSSSLLDEIYRSMDAGDENLNPGEFSFNLWEDKVSRKQSGGERGRGSSVVEDEGIATLRRAFLVQKWMDMKANAKNLTHRRRASSLPDSDIKSETGNDQFWSSDVVSRGSQKPSCFGPFRPKHKKADAFSEKHQQVKNDFLRKHQKVGNDYRFDDNQTGGIDHRAIKNPNVKKLKPPISPGGRLTTFLNSLFTNGHLKKPKDLKNVKIEKTSKSGIESTCSSASSFTRSCLSKNSPRSREKLNNGNRRTVQFYPVSVIIGEDCRPCGERFVFNEHDFMKFRVKTVSEKNISDDEEDYNDDDIASDASSDLFELDHLSILKECDELPVYETTHFGTNRAIAKGLIC